MCPYEFCLFSIRIFGGQPTAALKPHIPDELLIFNLQIASYALNLTLAKPCI